MTDEPKTIREVNLTMSGLGSQIGFHAKAFYAVASVAVVVAGVLFTKLDTVEKDTATLVKGQESIELRLSKIETLLESINTNTEQAAADMGAIRTALVPSGENSANIAGWRGFIEQNPAVIEALGANGVEGNVWIFQNPKK